MQFIDQIKNEACTYICSWFEPYDNVPKKKLRPNQTNPTMDQVTRETMAERPFKNQNKYHYLERLQYSSRYYSRYDLVPISSNNYRFEVQIGLQIGSIIYLIIQVY